MSGPDPATSTLRTTLPRRLRAAAIHFGLSAIAFAVASYLILFVWYPGFHFRVDGGWQGVRIMAAVDLVLGPLLTLVIFDPRKSRRAIAFDLSCIAIAQLGALGWGFYAIHSQHPVAISYEDAVFHPVPYVTVAAEAADFPVEGLLKLSPERPPIAWTRPPENDQDKERIALQLMLAGTNEYEDPYFLAPFLEHWDEVRKAGRTLEAQRREKNAAAATEFEAAGGPAGALFFDYSGRYGDCVLAFSPDGKFIGAYGCQAD